MLVVLHDEGCLTDVTSMNSSQSCVPAPLNQHDGHHHVGRGSERAKWCLVCSLRDRTTVVGAKGLGWAIGSLCAPPLPPGRCQLLRVVGFPSIFAWKSVSAEFRGYAPAKLASAFLFEVVFFATREDNEGNRAYTVRGRSGDSVLMHLPVHTLNSISGVSDNGRWEGLSARQPLRATAAAGQQPYTQNGKNFTWNCGFLALGLCVGTKGLISLI